MKYKKIYPYGKQHISWSDIWSVAKTLCSPFLTQGPKVVQFESALCQYTGAKYAVAVANGTLALNLAVASLDLESGFEGITTPITFVASANCIEVAGGRVVFADVDPGTINLTAQTIESKITQKTKVLIPVHFAGQSCDMQPIYTLAKKYNLFVIEDAAHAIGSRYSDSMVGSCHYSDMTIFSFHPVKTMTTGEGGAIMTNDPQLYERLQILRTIGITRNPSLMTQNDGPWFYEMHYMSPNCRITDIQASLGLSQIARLNSFVEKRRYLVELYREYFSDDSRFSFLDEINQSKAAFHLFPLLVNFDSLAISKVDFFIKLRELGIFTQVHYIPVHTQPYYRAKGWNFGDFPIAEKYYQKTISLPLYYTLNKSDVLSIVKIIKKLAV